MSLLVKNTALLTGAAISQKAIAFLYFAFIASVIGDEALGGYFLALGLVTTIGVIDDLGLTSVLIREVAKTPEKATEYLRNIISLKFLTLPVTILLAFLLPPVLGFEVEVARLTQLAIFVMLFDTTSLTFYGALRGLHVLKYEAIGIFIGQFLTALFGVTVLILGITDARWLIAALILGSAWNAIFSIFNVIQRLGVKSLYPSYSLGWQPLRLSLMFFLAAVFVKIYSYVDSFTINLVWGDAAVGIYAVAYKLTYAFQFLPLAFAGALFPVMSKEAHDKAGLRQTFLQAEWYMALLAAPVVFGIFAIAPELITLFYGSKFVLAIPVLQILIFVLIFIFLDFPMGSLMNATGRQGIKTAIMGITMIINLIANILLVPWLGIQGAAVSGLISFSFMFLAGFLAVRRLIELTFFDLLLKTGGLFVSGACMAAVVLLIKSFIYWPLTIPIGALIYVGIAFATRTISLDHLKVLSGLFSKKIYAKDNSPHA